MARRPVGDGLSITSTFWAVELPRRGGLQRDTPLWSRTAPRSAREGELAWGWDGQEVKFFTWPLSGKSARSVSTGLRKDAASGVQREDSVGRVTGKQEPLPG